MHGLAVASVTQSPLATARDTGSRNQEELDEASACALALGLIA
jgi:hypothetical protein